MIKKNKKNRSFYGTTTLGEKGQVVVPVEARQKMKLERGDKLLVFGFGNDMLAFSKLENLEKIASHLADKLKVISEIIKKTNK